MEKYKRFSEAKESTGADIVDIKEVQKATKLIDSYIGKKFYSYSTDSPFKFVERQIKSITSKGVELNNNGVFKWDEFSELPLFENENDCKESAKKAYQKWYDKYSDEVRDPSKLETVDNPKFWWNN